MHARIPRLLILPLAFIAILSLVELASVCLADDECGLQADLQRPEPRRLGRQSKVLARRATARSPARPPPTIRPRATRFSSGDKAPVDDFELRLQLQDRRRQLRHPVSQQGSGQVGRRRLPGRLRSRRHVLRHPLRRARPRHPGQSRPESHDRRATARKTPSKWPTPRRCRRTSRRKTGTNTRSSPRAIT